MEARWQFFGIKRRRTPLRLWKTLWILCACGVYKLMNIWESIRGYLQPKVSAESYNNWLKGTNFVSADGDTLFVSAPDRETRVWLETEFAGMVQSGIRELGLPIRHVRYEVQPLRGLQNQALAAVDFSEPEPPISSSSPAWSRVEFGNLACPYATSGMRCSPFEACRTRLWRLWISASQSLRSALLTRSLRSTLSSWARAISSHTRRGS